MKLKNYDFIETEDGSLTMYSHLYGEACHSTAGAIEETNLHYINGCQISHLSEKFNPINILEVGFGTGIGFEQTRIALTGKFFNFVSFEIDCDLIEYVLLKMKLQFIKDQNYYHIKNSHYDLKVYFGDARLSIKKMKGLHFHAIYQDAFSPKRNACLWTKEWFEDVKNIAHADSIMSTYSASSSIRKSMIAAGWKVFHGEKFGKKRSSTRAKLQGESEKEILERLKRSPAILLTDENYHSYQLEGKDEKNSTV